MAPKIFYHLSVEMQSGGRPPCAYVIVAQQHERLCECCSVVSVAVPKVATSESKMQHRRASRNRISDLRRCRIELVRLRYPEGLSFNGISNAVFALQAVIVDVFARFCKIVLASQRAMLTVTPSTCGATLEANLSATSAASSKIFSCHLVWFCHLRHVRVHI